MVGRDAPPSFMEPLDGEKTPKCFCAALVLARLEMFSLSPKTAFKCEAPAAY